MKWRLIFIAIIIGTIVAVSNSSQPQDTVINICNDNQKIFFNETKAIDGSFFVDNSIVKINKVGVWDYSIKTINSFPTCAISSNMDLNDNNLTCLLEKCKQVISLNIATGETKAIGVSP